MWAGITDTTRLENVLRKLFTWWKQSYLYPPFYDQFDFWQIFGILLEKNTLLKSEETSENSCVSPKILRILWQESYFFFSRVANVRCGRKISKKKLILGLCYDVAGYCSNGEK